MSSGSFDVNFTDTNSLSSTPFNNIWGDADEHSLSSDGLWLGSAGTDYTAMGIMQNPTSASAGEGYGLYSYTARYEYANQPSGDYLLLWRADNTWLDSAAPGLITEMDMLETFDDSSSMASTLHYYEASAGGGNGYSSHDVTGINLTALNVYSMDWEAGSLTFYINGKEIYQVTGSTVPKDYADGGTNQVMGMGAETETSPVGMYVTEAQYTSAADLATDGGATTVMAAQISRSVTTAASEGVVSGAGSSTTTASSGTTASATTTAGSTTTASSGTTADTASITVSAPGTVQEASVGVGVTVAETVTGTAGSTVYEAVFTKGYVAEESWTAVKLNSSGTATVNVKFEQSGDFLEVVNNTSSATVQGYSSAITITDATATTTTTTAATITVSAPGTVQEASVGAGVTVTETIKATGLSTVYAEVLTATGTVESGFQTVTIGSGGTGSVSLHLAKTGDYVKVVDNTSSPAVTATSTAVTITDPTAATVTSPSGVFSISSATDMNGVVTIVGLKETGTSQTIRLDIDNTYIGTMKDNAADGAFTFKVSDPSLSSGSHTALLTLDGSTVTAKMSFTVGSESTSTSSTATTTTGSSSSSSSSSSASTTTVATSGVLDVLGLKELAGQLQMTMTGPGGTLRETLDGVYKGTLWDNMPSGQQSFTLNDVSVGSHSMLLSIDGSSHTDTVAFTKSSAGVFTITSQHQT